MEPSDSTSGKPGVETEPESRSAEGPTVVESRTDGPEEPDGLTVAEWLAQADDPDAGEAAPAADDSPSTKPKPPAYPAEEPIDLTTGDDGPTTSETDGAEEPDEDEAPTAEQVDEDSAEEADAVSDQSVAGQPGDDEAVDDQSTANTEDQVEAKDESEVEDRVEDEDDDQDEGEDQDEAKADSADDPAATDSEASPAEKSADAPTAEVPKADPETEIEIEIDAKPDDTDTDTEPAADQKPETKPDDTTIKAELAADQKTETTPAEDATAVLTEIKALPAPEAGARIVRPADTGELPVIRPPRKGLRRLAIAGGVVVGLYLLLTAAWAVDTALHRDQAMRGVQLDDVGVGGQNRTQLAATVDDLTDRLANSPIEVDLDGTTVSTDPVSLGLRFDTDAMIDDALAARRGGFLPVRPVRWAANLFSSESIEPSYLVDDEAAEDATEELLVAALEPAVEPTIEMDDDRIVTVPGVDGQTVAVADLTAELPGAVEAGQPFRLDLPVQVAIPAVDQGAVETVVDEVNDSTAEAILVKVLDDEAEISPEVQRSWVELDTSTDEIGWVINEEQALDDLQPLFPTLGSEDQQAQFQVVDEEPIIIPASETVICCAGGSGEILADTIASPIPVPDPDDEDNEADPDDEAPPLRNAVLEPEVTGSDEGVAELESLGIIELVSTFTTNHACCENRVRNIQRFADLTQGVIIRPGETFSLNGHVGRRTRENGFFAAGAIAQGNFEDQVGGGISQYATTFFNAAFFAGLEFVEYQSHSIYISRYPRGREATISWPRPDLEVRNTTDYGILVWNEYTPTSITVSFYSTEHLEVEALPLLRSSDRQCRIDITPRLITFPDGSTVEDRVRAIYRPGEGLDCNGNSTRPEEEEDEPPPPPVPEPPPPEPPDDDDDDEVLPPDG